MSNKPISKRIIKALIAVLLLCLMVMLLLVWQSLPMPIFVLLITIGFIALGLLIKSLLSSEDET